tara:strand:- start:1127 stop:1351 length:225 start_codon:yes stop_codon:yes gene_type:complete
VLGILSLNPGAKMCEIADATGDIQKQYCPHLKITQTQHPLGSLPNPKKWAMIATQSVAVFREGIGNVIQHTLAI